MANQENAFLAVYVLAFLAVMLGLNWDQLGPHPLRRLWRALTCWVGWCGMVTCSDDTHIWGECLKCGRRAGVVSREACRRYMEAEERRERVNGDSRSLSNAPRT